MLRRNADTRVRHGEAYPAVAVQTQGEPDGPCVGELQRIRQQVLENLFQPARVGEYRWRHIRRYVDHEFQLLLGCKRLEGPLQRFNQAAYRYIFRRKFQLACLDLGDIEDVVDQVEQIIAG